MGIFSGGSGSGGSGIPVSGWVGMSALTYSSADAPTFVATTASDLRAIIGVGDRIKLTQTTDRYFIVTAIDGTTITVYGGTDYTLANAAIATPYYSKAKSPLGFPVDPTKWTVETTNTNDVTKANPTQSTTYGDTGLSPTGPNIVIPIGCWRVYYECILDFTRGSNGNVDLNVALSTASNSFSDNDFKALSYAGPSSQRGVQAVQKEKMLTLAAKTTYYMVILTSQTPLTSIDIRGDVSKTVLRAVCAYL